MEKKVPRPAKIRGASGPTPVAHGGCHETLSGIGLLQSHGSQRLLLYGETLLLRSHEI